jgi:hypothetical protein
MLFSHQTVHNLEQSWSPDECQILHGSMEYEPSTTPDYFMGGVTSLPNRELMTASFDFLLVFCSCETPARPLLDGTQRAKNIVSTRMRIKPY